MATCDKDDQSATLQGPGEPQRPEELHRRASSQRSCFHGVELWPELLWEDWELGREFTKTLFLKNIHSKLQKLQFRPPTSKYFTTLLPQIIILSPGTSFSMPVTFRPHEKCHYEDSIEFQDKDGCFQVSLRATVPCHALEVPESVLLPLCAVQHSSRITFLFKNVSMLQTSFQWECDAPFQLIPEHGLLKPRQECCVTVVFRPQEALVYQCEACCRFGDEREEAGSRCTVLLQGLAKYPFLQVRSPNREEGEEQDIPALHFGSVAVGCSVQKHFDILNPCPVTASFSLSQLREEKLLLGSEFSCNVTSGEVAPGASLRVKVTYAPFIVDTVSVDYLSINCPGTLSKSQLKVTGKCIGPIVTLSSSVVDFGCVEQGQEVLRTLELINSSPARAVYQWDLDCSGHSIFSIHPAEGTLHPHSCTLLKVFYRATQPIVHYRRVACLVLHGDPTFLDIIGTCHSELQQPTILRPRHLVLYHLHQCYGLTQYPPDLLRTMLQEGMVHLDQNGALYRPEQESGQGPDSATAIESTPMEEYFQACSGRIAPLSHSSSYSSSPHITVEPAELLFYRRSSFLSSSSSSSQSVSITNHTKGKLSLVWTTAPDSPFSVSPSSSQLGPLKSTSFRVIYTPMQLNTFHGAQLECFAVYKALQDCHEAEEWMLCPPWCVTVRVIGHSFQLGKEHFIPHCHVQHPQVIFPVLSVPSYRTVLFQNNGDLPLAFHLDLDWALNLSSPATPVCVAPSCGLIRPGEHQILTLRTTPSEESPKKGFNLSFQLNAAKHVQELTVFNVAEKPCVSFEGDGCLYFPPTSVGSQSQCSLRIKNLSHLPLRFQWKLPEQDEKLISVEPDSGQLQASESAVQSWFFSPLEEMMYTLKPNLTFWPIQTSGYEKSYLPLNVIGQGCKGSLQAENEVIELGQMLVGSCRSFEVQLVNSSLCTISFCLSVQQTLLDKELLLDLDTEPNALKLDIARGTIVSHSRILLQSTVIPQRRACYQWTISYQTQSASGSVFSSPQRVCDVRGEGVFPTLQVTDAHSGGSVDGLSKVQLWNLFSLDGLNEHLFAIPSPLELTYRTLTKRSLHRGSPIFTTTMLDFNFSAAPLGSEPSTVLLMFDNTGPITVHWAFLFPEDQPIELEYWAEMLESSSAELHQMRIQDNNLFGISPRSGTLLPGQQRAVHFSYRHDFTGADRLPVLLKLSHGREILLNFLGTTVERNRPYLHFPSSRHVFTPIAIGGFSPPRQAYELYNGGAVPACYEVDTAPLRQLQTDNFNHPVLDCLNPRGEVPPGKTAMLEWVFSPLEAKIYKVDVSIHIQEGESMLMTFEGCGFDSRATGFSAPLHFHDTQQNVPRLQKVPSPGQVVLLSEERMSLGDIPVGSCPTRILFLTNVSHTDTIHYSWELPKLDNQQVVQVKPDHGSLCPGESALCVLKLTSSGLPALYQLNPICQVTLAAALSHYHDALCHWEEERERQQHEFTLTETDFREGVRTLPPIRAKSSNAMLGGTCVRPTQAEQRAQRESATAWRRPEPPRPALLHLGVTARSHGLLDYQIHFLDQLDKFYLQRSFQSKSPSQASTSSRTMPPAGLPPLIHGPERDILTHTFTSLLMSLLNDPTFHQSLASGASELPPCFKQLRESLPSSPFTPPSPTSSTSSSHQILQSSSAPLFPSRQLSSGGADTGLREQCHMLGRAESAGQLISSRPPTPQKPCQQRTQETPHTQNPTPTQNTHPTWEMCQYTHKDHVQRRVKESIRRCAEFSDICEEVLLNTLQNLMMEAFLGEMVLSSQPSTISLPPVSKQ
ncbi:cilia- and flagella-associated protein 65 [Lampris incognitus]|uniref:cilia- and flagella-associated protein 65 n=1 Tax=Lampris incognitus TaxID=2546036 RepID=UPI0024B55D8A|nr:cilia- and flagella-associated protein 65 [Lampris incognitus]